MLLSHDVIINIFQRDLVAGVLPAILNCMVLAGGGVAPPIHKGAVF